MLSPSSCSACSSGGATPSSRSPGSAALLRSSASSCRTVTMSGCRRTSAMAWSRSAETMGTAPTARRSRPRSARSGPLARPLSRSQAARRPARASTTARRGTCPSPIARWAASSQACQLSTTLATCRMCARACVGQPMRSSSASRSPLRAWMASAACRSCRTSAGCICGRARTSATFSQSARTSSEASPSFFCSTASLALGKGWPTAATARAGPAGLAAAGVYVCGRT
mmetsp:Transcript_7771/g.24339  ORF Transcript_7771/g.24339 Transcript_7771/m.24339 type:complete len:228 (-) Transcript_7771:167-850(-)